MVLMATSPPRLLSSADLQYYTLIRPVAARGRLEEPPELPDDLLDLARLDHGPGGPEILHRDPADHDSLEVPGQESGPIGIIGQSAGQEVGQRVGVRRGQDLGDERF